MWLGAGFAPGKTAQRRRIRTIAMWRANVRWFSNHFAAEQGDLRPPCSFWFQFRDVGFAALELDTEAVPQAP